MATYPTNPRPMDEVGVPTGRMSRRLRFEILRRDEHKCRYCGGRAPDVRLTVDHVLPVSLGGPTEPANLVAACEACNSGKASVAPDSPLVEQVAEDAERWAAAMKLVVDRWSEQYEAMEFVIEEVDDAWSRWTTTSDGQPIPRPTGWEQSVRVWLAAGLTLEAMQSLIPVAMEKKGVVTHDRWRYFCGCCWRRLDQWQSEALAVVTGETS